MTKIFIPIVVYVVDHVIYNIWLEIRDVNSIGHVLLHVWGEHRLKHRGPDVKTLLNNKNLAKYEVMQVCMDVFRDFLKICSWQKKYICNVILKINKLDIWNEYSFELHTWFNARKLM